MKNNDRSVENKDKRRMLIRESDIKQSLQLLNAEFEEALERKRREGVSAVDLAAWNRMQMHFPENAKEIKEFEKEFPDCYGLFIWAMWSKNLSR